MSELYYKEALKLGIKYTKDLPILEELVTPAELSGGQALGMEQIPLELIVGTKNAGRNKAFAGNFMPLLDSDSEFAAKWIALCRAHVTEGIREPVNVYEYMNRFYVEEGNKRVSVMKFFGAYSIAANVIRIMPARGDSESLKLYKEFMAFYEVSGLRTIEFTKPGSYKRLQKLLGKAPKEKWTEEEKKDFESLFYYFQQAFDELKNKKMKIGAGDALLAYLSVYGPRELFGKSPREIKHTVEKVWEEIVLQQEEKTIDVKMGPEQKGSSLLKKILPISREKELKVGFIHDRSPATSGWTYAHDKGREIVQRMQSEYIKTVPYYNAMDNPDKAIAKAVKDKCNVIFTTSTKLFPASLKAAVEHPEVTILNCSLNTPHRYVRTYHARIYEVKYIIGAIAGALAVDGQVGYISDYPIFGQFAGINAFALGVQLTNPSAKVYLEWSTVGGIDEAMKRLTRRGINLVSAQDNASMESRDHRILGLSRIEEGRIVNLVKPIWLWGIYYDTILRQIRGRSYYDDYEKSAKAFNYYFGLSSGVVGLSYFDGLPAGTRKLAGMLTEAIIREVTAPFCGPIKEQTGGVIARSGQRLSPEQILNMDWLNENIVGGIPRYHELSDDARQAVDITGISASKEEGSL